MNNKYLLIANGILILMFLVAFGIIVKMGCSLSDKQDQLESSVVEMKQLADNIVRSQSEYVSQEDFKTRLDGLDLDVDAIKDDVKKLGARIDGISTFLAVSHGYKETDKPSDHTWPKPINGTGGSDSGDPVIPVDCSSTDCDPFGYLNNAQVKDLFEKFPDINIPFGMVTFKAWSSTPWDTEVYERKYKVTTVLAEDREGKRYVYNKFSIGVGEKDYEVPIQSAEYVQEMPEAQFEWWNPRIAIGFSAGLGGRTSQPEEDDSWVFASLAPMLYFSPFSYGSSRLKPDFLALQVGAGYDLVAGTGRFSISPIMWNLGSVSTVINNTYIGPNVGIDTDANVSVGGNVAVSF
jgi:hypothetical protein